MNRFNQNLINSIFLLPEDKVSIRIMTIGAFFTCIGNLSVKVPVCFKNQRVCRNFYCNLTCYGINGIRCKATRTLLHHKVFKDVCRIVNTLSLITCLFLKQESYKFRFHLFEFQMQFSFLT